MDECLSDDALSGDYRLIYDILIFGIDMPGTNRMDAGRLVWNIDSSVVILFVMSMAQYANSRYEVETINHII